MIKNKLLILLSALFLSLTISGCSLFSSNDGDDAEDVTVAEESVDGEESDDFDDEDLDDEGLDDDELSGGEEELVTDDEEIIDEYPDDEYGGEQEAQVADTDTEEETLFIGADDSGEDTVEGFQQVEQAETVVEEVADNASDTLVVEEEEQVQEYANVEEPVTPVSDGYGYSASSSFVAASFVPVKKMKSSPYQRSGTNINRLYIVRPGDNMKSISRKIYGSTNRSKDLYKWNSHFYGRTLKVGDKVYYSSALNPRDTGRVQLYYEEMNIPSQTYTARSGDSIRTVSKKLLGHSRSWMEVWATNDVDSKWSLRAGERLRYWPRDVASSGAQTVAKNDEVPEAPNMEEISQPVEEPPQVEQEQIAPEAQQVAQSEDEVMVQEDEADVVEVEEAEELVVEEPVEDPAVAAAQVAKSSPPPPPSQPVAPPPPPPSRPVAPPAPPTDMASAGDAGIMALLNGQDDSMMMGALGGLLILAALILLVFIRRSRKSKVKYS